MSHDALQVLEHMIADGALDFAIYAGPTPHPEHLIYDDAHAGGHRAQALRDDAATRAMNVVVPLDVGGQHWSAAVSTTPKFRASRSFASRASASFKAASSPVLLPLMVA